MQMRHINNNHNLSLTRWSLLKASQQHRNIACKLQTHKCPASRWWRRWAWGSCGAGRWARVLSERRGLDHKTWPKWPAISLPSQWFLQWLDQRWPGRLEQILGGWWWPARKRSSVSCWPRDRRVGQMATSVHRVMHTHATYWIWQAPCFRNQRPVKTHSGPGVKLLMNNEKDEKSNMITMRTED